MVCENEKGGKRGEKMIPFKGYADRKVQSRHVKRRECLVHTANVCVFGLMGWTQKKESSEMLYLYFLFC